MQQSDFVCAKLSACCMSPVGHRKKFISPGLSHKEFRCECMFLELKTSQYAGFGCTVLEFNKS